MHIKNLRIVCIVHNAIQNNFSLMKMHNLIKCNTVYKKLMRLPSSFTCFFPGNREQLSCSLDVMVWNPLVNELKQKDYDRERIVWRSVRYDRNIKHGGPYSKWLKICAKPLYLVVMMARSNEMFSLLDISSTSHLVLVETFSVHLKNRR